MPAALLRWINSAITKINGRDIVFGRVDDPYMMSIDGDIMTKSITVAASGTAVLYDGTLGDAISSTISFFWCRTDLTGMLQFNYDSAGANGEEILTIGVLGTGTQRTFGPPTSLPYTRGYSNYTEDFVAGTLIYADKVSFENLDSSNAATVEFFCGE